MATETPQADNLTDHSDLRLIYAHEECAGRWEQLFHAKSPAEPSALKQLISIRSELLRRLSAASKPSEGCGPTTLDGVPLREGMTVYRVTRSTGKVEPHIVQINAQAVNAKHGICWSATETFSTAEAASQPPQQDQPSTQEQSI